MDSLGFRDQRYIFPRQKRLEMKDGRFVLQYRTRPIDDDKYIQSIWSRLYEDAIREVAQMSVGRQEWIVYRLYPEVVRYDGFENIFMLYMDIMISKNREVVIPTFTYKNNRPIEWRCGSCDSINPMEARYCGEHGRHPYGCGRPRASLMQEHSDWEKT